jgi:hypothetical protein
MKRLLVILSLACSLGCAARVYRPPAFRSIELRGVTVSEERENRRTSSCHVGNWIYDHSRKLWIGVCR